MNSIEIKGCNSFNVKLCFQVLPVNIPSLKPWSLEALPSVSSKNPFEQIFKKSFHSSNSSWFSWGFPVLGFLESPTHDRSVCMVDWFGSKTGVFLDGGHYHKNGIHTDPSWVIVDKAITHDGSVCMTFLWFAIYHEYIPQFWIRINLPYIINYNQL